MWSLDAPSDSESIFVAYFLNIYKTSGVRKFHIHFDLTAWQCNSKILMNLVFSILNFSFD